MTLILILSLAGVTEFTVLYAKDPTTCDHWGQLSVASGDATSYRCITRL